MVSSVVFIAVLREIREHAAVRHVVPVDRDEERAFRAVGVDVWGAVTALAECIQVEISVRVLLVGLGYRLAYARVGHLHPGDDFLGQAVPVDTPGLLMLAFLRYCTFERLCDLDLIAIVCGDPGA